MYTSAMVAADAVADVADVDKAGFDDEAGRAADDDAAVDVPFRPGFISLASFFK